MKKTSSRRGQGRFLAALQQVIKLLALGGAPSGFGQTPHSTWLLAKGTCWITDDRGLARSSSYPEPLADPYYGAGPGTTPLAANGLLPGKATDSLMPIHIQRWS